MKNTKTFFLLLTLALFAVSTNAQTGGAFEITQSVIASGGGQNSAGGNFSLDGTIGQPLAGGNSSGGTFAVSGGFWAAPLAPLAPTAASGSISGQIKNTAGKGIRNVRLTLTGMTTGEIFYVRSGVFGFYRFENVPVGQDYILTVSAKRFTFNPNTILINLLGDLAETDFIGTDGF